MIHDTLTTSNIPVCPQYILAPVFRAVCLLLVHPRCILPGQSEQDLCSPSSSCYPCESGRTTRVALVKCGLAGWARLRHSLLNRCKVNIYSGKQQECQSPCSAGSFTFLPTAFAFTLLYLDYTVLVCPWFTIWTDLGKWLGNNNSQWKISY